MNAVQDWLIPDLLEGITEGVVVMDRKLRYVFVNKAAEHTIQRTAGQLVGRCVWDVFPEAKTSSFLPTFEEALATGLPTIYRGYVPERDQWFEQRCYPYSKGVTVLFHDITEQTRMAEALAETEGRFRTTADSAPVLIWISDTQNRRVFFNRAWTEFTGRTEEEESGYGWVNGVHPDDREQLLDLYNTSFEARTPFETEYRLRSHDGAYRWMLVRASPRYDANGEFEGFTGSCTDIHEKWSSERQMTYLAEASRLLSSTLDYESVLRQIAALVVPTLADWSSLDIVTESGSVERIATVHVDPEMVSWAEELARRYPTDLEQPGGLGHVVRTGESVLLSEIPAALIEAAAKDEEHLEIIRKLAMTSALIVPLKTRERVIGAISLVTTHGSRRYEAADLRFAEGLAARAGIAADNAFLYQQAREAEMALREVNEALEARVEARTAELAHTNHQLAVRNRELQDFAYVASHDLQEPLRKIRAFSDLLMVDYAPHLPEDARGYLSRVQDSAARMSTLIRDLLAFSRVTTQGETFVDVDLGNTLGAVLSDLEVRLIETNGRVELDGVLPTVHADAVQMHQLLLNLVGNALKFHRDGVAPLVRISAMQERGKARIVVEDNGIGFDQKYGERIFSPFQRLHARQTYEGTGMGLAIVRRIVERHSGTITASSTPDVGSRFEVTLPV